MQMLKVDPEFRDEIPPLEDSEKVLLEQALLSEGCRDPLVVWAEEGIIVDGHHRYDICTRHSIPFEVVRKSFKSRLHALVWMHRNQGARRNISKYYKDKQALRMVERLEALGKQNMAKGGGDKKSDKSRSGFPDRENPIKDEDQLNAWEVAAQTYGTSRTSMSRTNQIDETAPEPIKEAVANNDMSRTRGATLAKIINKLPESDRVLMATFAGESERKARIFVRLHKSSGSPETNGTYNEIVKTGGFHYGDDMDQWCDVQNDTVEQIETALKSIAEHHAREKAIARRAERQAQRVTDWQGPGWSGIIHGDMREVGQQIPDESIDVIFTDPPYPEEYLPLFSDLSALAERVLKPGGIVMAYSGQIYLPQVITRLSEHLDYVWTCAIRHSGGMQRIFKANVNTGWKPVLFYAKPPLKPYWDSFIDIVSGGREKESHEWQQAEAEAAHFIKALCPPGGTVFDPFAGGGTTLAAAQKLGLQYIGIEIDPDQVDIIADRLQPLKDNAA